MQKGSFLLRLGVAVPFLVGFMVLSIPSARAGMVNETDYTEDWAVSGWRVARIESTDPYSDRINAFLRPSGFSYENTEPATSVSPWICLGPAQWQVDVSIAGKTAHETWDGINWADSPAAGSNVFLSKNTIGDYYRYDTFYTNDADATKKAVAQACSNGRITPVQYNRVFKYTQTATWWYHSRDEAEVNACISYVRSIGDDYSKCFDGGNYYMVKGYPNETTCVNSPKWINDGRPGAPPFACSKKTFRIDYYNDLNDGVQQEYQVTISPGAEYGAIATNSKQIESCEFALWYGLMNCDRNIGIYFENAYQGDGVRGDILYRGGLRSVPGMWSVNGKM